MDFLKKNKTTIGGGAALLLAGYVYFTYFSGGSAPLTALSADQAVSGELLVTLNSLGTIDLDNKIFSNPVFVSLSDFGVSIPPQESGRRNPFAPI
ncbi:MAG: hypothetical protein AAB919_02750 [Patescibacteria group bacterium]